ncbi:hypothetical protein CDIK_1729 [Cucumispora dikerogammari]|nr:hypothetical protein CDIK_1729 [Cucumispora dikerogammari]
MNLSALFLHIKLISVTKRPLDEDEIKQINWKAEESRIYVFEDPIFYKATAQILVEIRKLLRKDVESKFAKLEKTLEDCGQPGPLKVYMNRTSIIIKNIKFINKLMLDFKEFILLKQRCCLLYKNFLNLPHLTENTINKYVEQRDNTLTFKTDLVAFLEKKVGDEHKYFYTKNKDECFVISTIREWIHDHEPRLKLRTDVIQAFLNDKKDGLI